MSEDSNETARAIRRLAKQVGRVADALHALGTNHAVTPSGSSMGAIEVLAVSVKEGFSKVAQSIEENGR